MAHEFLHVLLIYCSPLLGLLSWILLIKSIEFFGPKIVNLIQTLTHLHQEHERSEFETTRVWASMEHYRQDEQFNIFFGERAKIARLMIRVLPPVKIFDGDETSDCSICMEKFKKGELIQPFVLCAHEFHYSCINSWLLGGKTTCPICRQDLSTTVRST
jgi:hypothetical protein